MGPETDAGPDQSLGQVKEPVHLTTDATALTGVTSDDYAIYRADAGIAALSLKPGGSPAIISTEGGSILIRKTFVFMWANVDWATFLGDLTIWNARQGVHQIGNTVFGEDVVTSDDTGETILYFNNVREDRMDLMVASDLRAPTVLLPDVGRGSETTCRANFRFIGKSAFVSWCQPGTRTALLQRFDPPAAAGGEWQRRTLASEVQSTWSADGEGQRLFYIGADYRGYFAEGGTTKAIDAGVTWGMMLNDGSAVLYTVGDQLRRSSVPEVTPTPIVTTGFVARTDWSPDLSRVLYSKTITYEGGTRRDLYMTETSGFNPEPVTLVSEPRAQMTRSSFTADSKYVMYLSDAADGGTTLQVRPVAGGEAFEIQKADTAESAWDSRVVFSDNRSSPDVYPILADLKVVQASTQEIVTLKERIVDGRTFYVTADKSRVVYIMPPSGDPERIVNGLYVQEIP
jgi:hypothetical protein